MACGRSWLEPLTTDDDSPHVQVVADIVSDEEQGAEGLGGLGLHAGRCMQVGKSRQRSYERVAQHRHVQKARHPDRRHEARQAQPDHLWCTVQYMQSIKDEILTIMAPETGTRICN